MKFSFHPEARAELIQATDYYRIEDSILGLEFLGEVFGTISRIIEFPKAFPNFSKNTRRCLINRFPFAVIYQIRQNEIFIVGITNLSRKPGYWKERIRK